MPYITAAVIAGTAIYGAIDASSRRKKAEKQINALKKIQPKYKSAQDIQMEAETSIQYGYSPSERAAFQQSMAQRGNKARRIATDRNPNLAGAINAGINYGDIHGNLQFAASDAQLKRQKQSEYANRLTHQYNSQTGADITNKRDQEMAYGMAKQQANADIYNSIMQLGYAGASAGKAYQGQQTGATGTTQPLGGNQIPSIGAVNNNPTAGSDMWGRNLYGNPNPQQQQPYFGTTQFGYPQYGTPFNSRPPSRQAYPNSYDYSFSNLY